MLDVVIFRRLYTRKWQNTQFSGALDSLPVRIFYGDKKLFTCPQTEFTSFQCLVNLVSLSPSVVAALHI